MDQKSGVQHIIKIDKSHMSDRIVASKDKMPLTEK